MPFSKSVDKQHTVRRVKSKPLANRQERQVREVFYGFLGALSVVCGSMSGFEEVMFMSPKSLGRARPLDI
jgi:hypothetical protein